MLGVVMLNVATLSIIDLIVTLIMTFDISINCHCAVCRILLIVILNVIMLSVVVLNVVGPYAQCHHLPLQ